MYVYANKKHIAMKKSIHFIFVVITQFSFAQNLVNNWSFEDTIQCPDNVDQMSRASGWSSFRGTPDYFNSCSSGLVGIPSNWSGNQYPRTGNAYAAFITYYLPGQSPRECIGISLNQTLVIGNEYFLSFYVSRAANNFQLVNIASNKIGAKFSTVPYSYSSPIPIDNFAHVFTDSVIYDTLNWVNISGLFTADSAYQYLSIGNFFTDLFTTHVRLDSSAGFAYYYIDDITLLDSNSTGINENNPNKIKIFPNPARDWIVLEGGGIKSVEITNALGSKIGSYPTTASALQHKINLGSLGCGVYFLKINMINERFQFQKLIVQN